MHVRLNPDANIGDTTGPAQISAQRRKIKKKGIKGKSRKSL
jgi:hypothetical protein